MPKPARLLYRSSAELLGTFWLVFGVCGSAVLAASFSINGFQFLCVAVMFGLSMAGLVYSAGRISGCHLNPAISVSLALAKRFGVADLPAYVASQMAGAILGAGVMYFAVRGKVGFKVSASLTSNGYGAHAPGLSAWTGVLVTFLFVIAILWLLDHPGEHKLTAVTIGTGLTLLQLITLAVTTLSLNPWRGARPAVFISAEILKTLWVCGIPSLLGGVLAAYAYMNVTQFAPALAIFKIRRKGQDENV